MMVLGCAQLYFSKVAPCHASGVQLQSLSTAYLRGDTIPENAVVVASAWIYVQQMRWRLEMLTWCMIKNAAGNVLAVLIYVHQRHISGMAG